MKHRIIFLIVAVVFVGLLFAADNVDEAKEIEAIKKVIINETEFAVNQRNYDAWTDTWFQESDVLHLMGDRSGFQERNGWAEISSWVKKGMEDNPKPRNWKITKENFKVHMDGNLAWSKYDDYWDTPEGIWRLKQTRTLIKKDGEWKIISVVCAWDDTYKPDFKNGEMYMRMIGKDFLGMDKVKEAIEVFELNAKFYPESDQVYANLGEAHMKAGNSELAMKNYKKSLQLNPDNSNAKEMLEKMSAK